MGLSGCYERTADSPELQALLSTMTEFAVKGEYSIYYADGWTSMLANKLWLVKDDSVFKLEEIIKASKFKANKVDEQLDHFYDVMVEYVEFVENTPSGDFTFESLGFEKSDVYLTENYCIAIAPFEMSDGKMFFYLVAFDRISARLARFRYVPNDEATYLDEIAEIRKMLDTFKMTGVTKEKTTIPDFSNISSATPEYIAAFLGTSMERMEIELIGKNNETINLVQCRHGNSSYYFADGVLGGVYFEPGDVLFRKLDGLTDKQVKSVLAKYGITITNEVSVMQNMEKQPDGRFLTTTKLVGWFNEVDGVTDTIKSIELQKDAFRVIYNEELFELIYDAVIEEGIFAN